VQGQAGAPAAVWQQGAGGLQECHILHQQAVHTGAHSQFNNVHHVSQRFEVLDQSQVVRCAFAFAFCCC
jgi:hypothetical protein